MPDQASGNATTAGDPDCGGSVAGRVGALADGALLCSHHHHTVHSEHWQYRLHPSDGIPEYKQAGSDVWQRNHRWRA